MKEPSIACRKIRKMTGDDTKIIMLEPKFYSWLNSDLADQMAEFLIDRKTR